MFLVSIWQNFERPFRRKHLVLALQFSFKFYGQVLSASFVVGLHRNGDRFEYFLVRYYICHELNFMVLFSQFCSLAAIPIVTVRKICFSS